MYEHDRIYLDGAWLPSSGTESIEVFDSTDGSVIGRVPQGTSDDVDKAANAAAAAFPDWAARSASDRAAFCVQIADGLAARADEIATIVRREAGVPKRMSLAIQGGLPENSFRTAAQVAEIYE